MFEKVYGKKINRIYVRYKLLNEKQRLGESMDSYVLRLLVIATGCGFSDVNAIECKNKTVLQSFVSGLEDSYIR